MRKLLNHTRHWIFPRRLSRRGSILIMVVAVLVLLALMGTAYISTVRLDRQSGAPLLEASPEDVLKELADKVVPQMAQDAIVQDVVVTTAGVTQYRPADEPQPPMPPPTGTYDNWDYASANWWRTTPPTPWVWQFQNDAWLADRLPELVPATGIPARPDIWVWKSLSRPLDQPDPATATSQKMFVSPYQPGALPASNFLLTYPYYSQDQDPAGPAPQRVYFIPSDLTISYPATYSTASLQNKTRVFPALIPFDATTATMVGGAPVKLLAADADGDGIADAGLWPITEVDGIQYYAAVRIIDNSSAINVNTARSRTGEFAINGAGPTAPISAIFPSNVGLFELFQVPPAQQAAVLNAINQYEFNIMGNPASTAAAPFEGTDASASSTPRTDFAYASQAEAQYFAITSRMENPGFRAAGAPPPAGTADARVYMPFMLEDNGDLIYRFGMMNARTDSPIPESTLDLKLYTALPPPAAEDPIYWGAPNNTPYPATPAANSQASFESRFKFFPNNKTGTQFWNGTIDYWFEYSYDFTPARATWAGFAGAPPVQPVRSLLTTSNAVSNLISGHVQGAGGNVANEAMLPYGCKGRWNTTYTYVAADIVYHTVYYAAPDSPRTNIYICLTPNTNAPPETAGGGVAAQWLRYNPRGVWTPTPATPYVAGDVVRYTATPDQGDWKIYLALADPGATLPDVVGGGWVQVPGYIAPPRASLNTATFGELFRGFWNVMAFPQAGGWGGTPFDAAMTIDGTVATEKNGATAPPTFNNPYIGMQFFSQAGDASAVVTPGPFAPKTTVAQTAPVPPEHPLRMFRSPLRSIPLAAPPAAAPYTDDTRRLTPHSVMMLRAAIAAVNAEDIRDADNDVTARKISVQMQTGAGASTNVDAVVYGTEAQPFITEIYASSDTSTVAGLANPQGYVAIELHNPYPFDIPLTNWRIAILNRVPIGVPGAQPVTNPNITLTDAQVLVTFPGVGAVPAAPMVPAYGYLVLENYRNPADVTSPPAVPGTATYRPVGSGLPLVGPIRPSANPGPTASPTAPRTQPYPPAIPQLNVAYIPLPAVGAVPNPPAVMPNTLFNQEMVLMKPRLFSGVYTGPGAGMAAGEADRIGYTDDDPATNPLGTAIQDFIPVDSFDFTGLVIPNIGQAGMNALPQTLAQQWHYMRASNANDALPATKIWHHVYPGRYDATNSIVAPLFPSGRARHAGTWEVSWDPATVTDPWDTIPGTNAFAYRPVPEMTLGSTYGAPGVETSNASILASYPTTFPLQLAFNNFRVATAAVTGSSIGKFPIFDGDAMYAFPFGAFQRTGEVLHVPFIGAYRITLSVNDPGFAPDTVVELNTVSMDAAMAEDTATFDDPVYDAGGVPAPPNAVVPATLVEHIGRFCPRPPLSDGVVRLGSYDWASDVLDHFTAIQNPHDDFIPNLDPAALAAGALAPSGVANTVNALANTDKDWGSGVQGLINVNTASAKVLSMLPLVVDATGAVVVGNGTPATNLNQILAERIVSYRDVNDGSGMPHGPFKSLFELNDVFIAAGPNGFMNMMGTLPLYPADIDDAQGDFTPAAGSFTQPGWQEATDNVRLDFEEYNLNVIRLSNLLTTRSDTFTAYILVQGWKGSGTATPELVAERRSAFTIDRNEVGTTGGTVKKVIAPTR